jgi:superfamily II DNA or RNA helicase
MKELLKKIDPTVLIQIIGKVNIQKIGELLQDSSKAIDLSDIALAFYGDDIFENKRIRMEAIKTLPEEVLRGLSIKYCGKTFPSKEAASIQLTAKPWTINSSFALDLIRSLSLEFKYLPKKQQRLSSSELIEPLGIYYPLFDYQVEIKDRIIAYLNREVPRFIVQMPTGSGKTKTTLEALIGYNADQNTLNLNQSLIWIAHTEELCEQAIETLSKVWRQTQDVPLRIVRLFGGYDPTPDELLGSFIVSSYQKLCSKNSEDYLEILSDCCRIVTIDEAHKALATTYKSMLGRITSKGAILIGLTATPGRTSKEILPNSEFSQLFNRKIITPTFSGNPIHALRELNVLSKLDHLILESNVQLLQPEKGIDQEENDFSQNQLRNLWMNSKRNKLIINTIINEITLGNPCLVFTCSVEHSVILASALNFNGIQSKFVDSNQKKTHRRNIINDFKEGKYDVLLNFGVLTTGFDAPRIKTVIITRPTTSIVLYSQMIGRGLRGKRMGGNETCKIIDIKDNLQDFGPIEDIYDFFDGYWE